jgi:hypothetical protein
VVTKAQSKTCSRQKKLNSVKILLLKQSDFFGGYKRLIAKEKEQGIRKTTEGKAPLNFKAYRFLSKKALSSTNDFVLSTFSHVFLLLCWNVIARCVSVASLMYDHITWEEDSMVIVFPTTKADQEGKNCSPKHVFANVQCPEICPILSFAIFLFTSGVRRERARNHGYIWWTWNSAIHFVPQDFTFPPNMNLTILWHLWWDGKPAERIAPYRKLGPNDFCSKLNKNYFIKARKVMDFLKVNTQMNTNQIV